MKHKLTIVVASSVLAYTAVASAFAQQSPATQQSKPVATLHVGDSAPSLAVEAWLKGEPVTSLADGKVHVVEFWATWCGPCKAGMPHLCKIAAQYGQKVVVTGISVWEDAHEPDREANVDHMPMVRAFVERAGDMMAYPVAADGRAGQTAKTWLSAAGISGIPTAFVIDGQGRIAWIGSPSTGMDEVIDLLVKNKYDTVAAKKIADEWAQKRSERQGLLRRLRDLLTAGQWEQAKQANEQMLVNAPFMDSTCAAYRYVILTHTDPAAAADYGKSLLETQRNAPLILERVAHEIVDDKNLIAGPRDYELASRLFNRASVLVEPQKQEKEELAFANAKLSSKEVMNSK